MEMTTAVPFSEDYADRWVYSRAARPLPKPGCNDGPDRNWEYLPQVKPEGNHGDAFHYKTIDSDMLGWMISRITGKGVPLAGGGVHGQTIYVDPAADMVLLRPASFPRAQNVFIDPTSLPAYQAVAEYLMKR